MARPTLMTHRKFQRFARSVASLSGAGVVAAAVMARGILEVLWDACYEAGDEYLGTASDIDHRIGWTGQAGTVALALVACGLPEGQGFIEPIQPETAGGEVTYRVHDLWHHAPDYVQKRRQRELDRQRKEGPSAGRRRTAPTLDWQEGDGRTPSPAPSLAPSPDQELLRTPSPDDLVALWNRLVTPPIPQVTKLTADRRTKIDARLKVYPDLATWRTAITWLNGQDWCRAPGRGEHPHWTATLDWLCKNDGQMARVLEWASVRGGKSGVRGAPTNGSDPVTPAERSRAQQVWVSWGRRCRHTEAGLPECANSRQCVDLIIESNRAKAAAS